MTDDQAEKVEILLYELATMGGRIGKANPPEACPICKEHGNHAGQGCPKVAATTYGGMRV